MILFFQYDLLNEAVEVKSTQRLALQVRNYNKEWKKLMMKLI